MVETSQVLSPLKIDWWARKTRRAICLAHDEVPGSKSDSDGCDVEVSGLATSRP